MKGNGVVQPFRGPAVLHGNFADSFCQPLGPRLSNLGNIDVLRAEAKVAGQHQRRSAINCNVESRVRRNCGTSDLIEGVEKLFAIKARRHRSALQPNSPPSARIISMKPGKLVAMKAVSSTCTGLSLARPITSADIAMR